MAYLISCLSVSLLIFYTDPPVFSLSFLFSLQTCSISFFQFSLSGNLNLADRRRFFFRYIYDLGYLFSICSSFTFYETLIFLVAYSNFTHATSEINVSCNYSYSVLLLLRNISMSLFARSLSIQFSTSLYVYDILQCLSLYLVFALFHFCSSLYLIVSDPTQHFVLRLNFYFLPHL